MVHTGIRHLFAALCAASLLGCGSAPPAPQAAAAVPDEGQRLHALLEAEWEHGLRDQPERATFAGERRYGDRLADLSPQAVAARRAHEREWLQALHGVKREALAGDDRLSLDIARYEAELRVAEQAHPGLQLPRLHPLFAVHGLLAGLLRNQPAETEADLQAIVARMNAYPRRVDQEIALLQQGLQTGWRTPRPVLQRVIEGIDAQLVADPRQHPAYEPFKRPATAQTQRLRQAWTARAEQALREQVMPAQHRLRAFLVQHMLPGAPATGALHELPGGPAAYRHLVKINTTTDLSPEQIHAIGLEQLARLRAEMDGVRRATGFAGDFAAFVHFLHTDKRFFVDSEEALLVRYRDAVKRTEPELPRLFAELPRAPLGVRAYPAFMGPDAAASYSAPAQDGSRAGWFSVPTVGVERKPVWEVESLAVHEGVPGHHLQVARAAELKNLPKFRRSGGYVAFNEGWALYAETLGFDLGLYTDPYSKFGHLQMQAFRAARLVVDTGLHAKGWSREQAIEFMVQQVGHDRGKASFEVDRYLAMPAQALGYMIGQLKIMELRDRAKQKLGPRFDIRRFHNAVIDNGSLPLPVLERVIDEWIAKQA
ncbi:MAG: DUF885 domain-containing protein [Pseudomonadota bacterium]